ncbi:MAG: aldo/keto reductase [Ancalomicrobiaceae bacterium]|nr:aldo/keto reductase [Ancalomicrobiaceae bacterium]
MDKRRLGRSDLFVSPICFGGNVFGWTADEARSHELLDAFIDRGASFIDTADVYSRWVQGNSGGDSEAIIGRWLKRRGGRDKLIIATKVGMDMGDGKVGLAPAYIRRAVEDSLRRLQTDHIDLYQSHTDDPATPLEATLEAYARLIEEGKVRFIGASNYSAERLAAALDLAEKDGYPRYQTIQPEYSLYCRASYEAELQPLAVEREISCISYFSLANGFLSGKYRSEKDLAQSKRGERAVGKYLNERGFRILDALRQVAGEATASMASVALAWLMTRASVAAPIASATSIAQVEDLIAAARLTLSAEAVERLTEASNGG